MIKRSLLAAGALLVLHAAFVKLAPPHRPMAQHQWQQNLIKAQGLIYGPDGQTENVLVGSSLSGRLVMEKLPDIYNLALGGLGIFDGLEVVSESKKRPKIVFVEMNLVLRGGSEDFKSSLNQPILFHLRRLFPSMREENQPVATLMKALSRPGMDRPPRPIAQHGPSDAGLLAKMLAIKQPSYAQIPAKTLIEERFGQLKSAVHELEKRGADVVFFEMPVNEKLSDSPKMRTIREWFRANFPPSEYNYIATPDGDHYVTTDGEHLEREEALRYTEYFKTAMSKGLTASSRPRSNTE